MEEIKGYIFVLTLSLCAFSDIYKRKIPNMLLIAAVTLMLPAKLTEGTLPESTAAALALMAILFPLYLFGMAGAGDIKLAAFIFFSEGPARGGEICFAGLVTAGLWSLIKMAEDRTLIKRFSGLACYIRMLRAICAKDIKEYPDKMAGEPLGELFPKYYRADRDGYAMTIPLALCMLSGSAVMFIVRRIW